MVDEPIVAWLRDAQPDAEDEALVVCAKGDPGSFPVYRALPSEPGVWQPIETAPKDGETEVLTYRAAGIMSVAVYWPHGDADWCCVDGIHLVNVTHWQPLPAPPALTPHKTEDAK